MSCGPSRRWAIPGALLSGAVLLLACTPTAAPSSASALPVSLGTGSASGPVRAATAPASPRWTAAPVATPGCREVMDAAQSSLGPLAVVCGDDLASDVQIVDTRTGSVTVVTSNARVRPGTSLSSGPAWSPDGRRLAFVTDARLVRADTDRYRDVYVYTPDASRRWHLVSTLPGTLRKGRSSGPAWSGDSRWLAWSSATTTRTDPSPNPDLYVTAVPSWTTRQVNTARGGRASAGGSSQPAWSPDSSRLAYTWLRRVGSYFQVRTYDLAAGSTSEWSVPPAGATGTVGDSTDAAWDSTGRVLAFTTEDSRLSGLDGAQVVSREAPDGPIRVLSAAATPQEGDSYLPEGSPVTADTWVWTSTDAAVVPRCTDGCYRNVVLWQDGRIATVTLGTDGRSVDSDAYWPEWTPDGRWIVYTSDARNLPDAGRRDRVYAYDLAGGETSVLSIDAAGRALRVEGYPVIAADSSVLFTVADGRRSLLYRATAA